MGTGQLVTQGELHTDLQMMTGKTLVVGRRHLVEKRETGDPVRLCVPDTPGSGKILRWLNIVSTQRAALRSKTHFDGSHLFRHVEHLVVQSLQGLLLNLTHPFQKGLWRIHAVAGIGLEQLNNLFETSTRPNPVAHSFHLLFESANLLPAPVIDRLMVDLGQKKTVGRKPVAFETHSVPGRAYGKIIPLQITP